MKKIIEETDKYIIHVEKWNLPYCKPELRKAIECKECGFTSWNKNDVKRKYCGNCDKWLAEPQKIKVICGGEKVSIKESEIINLGEVIYE